MQGIEKENEVLSVHAGVRPSINFVINWIPLLPLPTLKVMMSPPRVEDAIEPRTLTEMPILSFLSHIYLLPHDGSKSPVWSCDLSPFPRATYLV